MRLNYLLALTVTRLQLKYDLFFSPITARKKMSKQIFNACNRIEADKFPDEEILSESINSMTIITRAM